MMKNERFELVSAHDPAWSHVPLAALIKYTDGGGMPADLPEWPAGVDPIVYTCRRLSRTEVFDHVEVMNAEAKKFYRAFAFGVVAVRGGRFGHGWEPSPSSAQSRVLSEEDLDYLETSPREIEDIGSVIYCRSTRPKDSAPRYPRQPSSVDAWAANAPRSAARSRDDAQPGSDRLKGE